MKKWIPAGAAAAVLLAGSWWLLRSDAMVFLTWYLLALVLGFVFMPVSGRIFASFDDKGWVFSKALAVAVTGYLEWLLVCAKAVRFTTGSCVAVAAICALAALGLFFWQSARGFNCMPDGKWQLVVWEEIIFFAAFLLWTYIAGFNAAAYGTEKFMDYGFMEAMMRSPSLPARDLWYSDGVINYYYGGQYFAVFLTKLSTSHVALTYNLMRTFVAGLAFVMPFSLVRQMLSDRMTGHGRISGPVIPSLGGLTAGLAVSIAGNMHYVVYAAILPLIRKFTGQEPTSYWFPDATRYIGYNPDVPDKTIHEFPCYSFILGDLHAHVVNIMFVLLMLGVLYAWLCRAKHSRMGEWLAGKIQSEPVEEEGFLRPETIPVSADIPDLDFKSTEALFADLTGQSDLGEEEAGQPPAAIAVDEVTDETFPEDGLREQVMSLPGLPWKELLLNPWILTAAFLLGLYHLNNYWDFVIYIVVASGTALFINIIEMRGKPVHIIGAVIVQAAWMFVLADLLILPFTVRFETMVDGVGIASHHSLPHQLLVLWGLPVFLGILFFVCQLKENLGRMKLRSLGRLMDVMKNADLFALLLFFCALGLVLIPELVYVRDIYENGNARANTMFKLTYQAYMMFGIMMGYVIWNLLAAARSKVFTRILAGAGLFFLCWTVGYFGNCVHSWAGGFRLPQDRAGLDALAYLDRDFPADVEAIYWLKDNVKDVPVVLEANGDSYTNFERVSATTGLPTVLGWYVHEWLWRGDPEDLNIRGSDVDTIYTSDNREMVQHLLKQYDISYIFIGSTEWEKYADRINYELLQELAPVVYSDPNFGTCIMKVL